MNKEISIKNDFVKELSTSQKLNLNIIDSSNIKLDVNNKSQVHIVSELNANSEVNINLDINIYKNCSLKFDNLDIKNNNTKINININLLEENAQCTFNNIVIAKNRSSIYKVNIINNSSFTKGLVNQKAVVKDEGVVKFNTTGDIKKDAHISTNYQEGRVLLLDNASYGESSPLLLIENNEVKAGHKASVSRVDEEQLYYLQLRGISKNNAENLLTVSFIKSILDNMYISKEKLEEITNGERKNA